ncbi:MAG: hypothetical protein ACM3SQ_07840 [Betaproteobacteria bacterium]
MWRRAAFAAFPWKRVASIVVAAWAIGLRPAAAQVKAPSPDTPSPLELALTDYRCSARHIMPDTDAYHECLSTELLALRTDFGKDLERLSRVERGRIDSACSRIDASLEREAYLRCVDEQLAGFLSRRGLAGAGPQSAPANAADAAAAGAPALPAPAAPASRSSGRGRALWIVAALVAAAGAAGGVAFLRRPRLVRGTCRTCGREVPGGGDLCPECRHEAAEALRRAAADRAQGPAAGPEEQQARTGTGEPPPEVGLERPPVRPGEEERLQGAEHEHREDEAHRRGDVSLRDGSPAHDESPGHEEEAPGPSEAENAAREDPFDPYAVLGVESDAGPEAIRTAYEAARAKYDPELVAGMGFDAQRHFARKLKAVERAWQTLSNAEQP